MKPSTIATIASHMSEQLRLTPRKTKSEAHAIFTRIAAQVRTRKQAAESLAEQFFDLNPEDETDSARIQRTVASLT